MDTIEINGKSVRVECNFNALAAYLRAEGEDTIQGLIDLPKLKPSRIPALMAACINEGERLEGRESALNGLEIGTLGVEKITEFIVIYNRQSRPDNSEEDASEGKKKAERQSP